MCGHLFYQGTLPVIWTALCDLNEVTLYNHLNNMFAYKVKEKQILYLPGLQMTRCSASRDFFKTVTPLNGAVLVSFSTFVEGVLTVPHYLPMDLVIKSVQLGGYLPTNPSQGIQAPAPLVPGGGPTFQVSNLPQTVPTTPKRIRDAPSGGSGLQPGQKRR